MSLTADALQPQLVRGLITLRGRPATTRLADVITNPPGAGFDLDFDAASSVIRIDFREPEFIASAISADASRFAGACFTSIHSVAPALERPESLAWGLVKMYYAAFYGGHSLLRLLGRSCSQLEGRHITKIKVQAAAREIPTPFNFGAGLYNCSLNAAQTGLNMSIAGGRVGGAHEAFWEILDQFFSEVTEQTLTGNLGRSDALAVYGKLEALRSIYRKGAGASWLSAIRNEIQYRHARDVWQPATISRDARSNLSRLASQWVRDPMNIDVEVTPGGDLGAFTAACAFTAALCRVVLARVADRSSAGANSFARHPLRLS